MRGHCHDCARAVACKNVVGKIHGNFAPVHGVDAVRARKDARFFACGRKTVDLARFGGVSNVLIYFFAPIVGREFEREGVFGGKHDVGHAVNGIATRRVNADRLAVFASEFDFAAHRFPDPVALHVFGFFGPVERIQSRKQFFGIIGDLKKPLRQIFAHDFGSAPLAFAAFGLFVGKYGIAGRAPVYGRLFSVCKFVFVQLQKHPLRPFVIIFAAGLDFRRPVEHRAHRAQLSFHRFDVFIGRILRVHACLDRVILGGQPERVETHRLKHVITLHLFEAGIAVGRAVVIPVPDVQFCAGRVREHFQNVVFGLIRLFVEMAALAFSQRACHFFSICFMSILWSLPTLFIYILLYMVVIVKRKNSYCF